jgi:hypothetical protein
MRIKIMNLVLRKETQMKLKIRTRFLTVEDVDKDADDGKRTTVPTLPETE